jgi:hypothetical protein
MANTCLETVHAHAKLGFAKSDAQASVYTRYCIHVGTSAC